MESKHDRFLRLKSTLRLIQDDQMMINHLADELVSAETELTESLNAKNLVDSEIVATEKKHNIRAKDLPKKLKQDKNRIFMEFRNNQNIVSKKHRKLGDLTWSEYVESLREKASRGWIELKLLVLMTIFGILSVNLPEDIFGRFNIVFGLIMLSLGFSALIVQFIPMTEAETDRFVKKMIEKHKDIETETVTAKSKILKLENAKKQIVKQLESIKQVLSVQSELMKKIEALGEKITDSAEQMIKLQTDVSHNWDSITDLIPSDSTMMFPKQLND